MSLRPSPHKPACRKQSVLDWLAKSEFRNGLRVPTTIERCWQRFAFYGVPRGDIVSLLGAANILSGVLRPTPGAKRRPSAGPSFFTFSGRSGDSFYAFSSGPGIFRLAPSYVPKSRSPRAAGKRADVWRIAGSAGKQTPALRMESIPRGEWNSGAMRAPRFHGDGF
jgi:hypothetical protein